MSSYKDHPIEELAQLPKALHALHLSQHCQSLAYRLHYLKQVAYLLIDNERAILDATFQDLGRHDYETKFTEIWSVKREVDLAVKRLKSWMADESGWTDTILAFKTNYPRVKKQPKGVALVIGPWNYPFFLSLSPLVSAIAAGCPVVIKPSEHSPHTSALLQELISKYMDPQAHIVILGGVQHSTELLKSTWGHVFFTGSPSIGRIVAAATAKTLVSSTLELGGKSPVIITKSADLKISARRILSIKMLGAGQMCTNADYILCPKELVQPFMAACKEALAEFYPVSPTDVNMSKLIHTPHYNRISKFVREAREGGYEILGGQEDEAGKKVGLTVVNMTRDKGDKEEAWMREEIFGPILPVVGIESVDKAIDYINARPNPLALYVFSTSRKEYEYILDKTLSGGACWNDVALQTLQRGVPFGGVGESGWGSCHGRAGFDAFTHRRSTMEVPFHLEILMRLRYPSAPAWGMKVFEILVGHHVSFARSKSVQDEQKRLNSWSLGIWGRLLGVVGLAAAIARLLQQAK